MINIYISGKNGFIGSSLTDKLRKDSKYQIIEEEFRLDEIQKIKVFRPEIIVHCAAKVSSRYCEENLISAFESNVRGTLNIAEVARDMQAYLIYLSSVVVYNFKADNNVILETSKVNPHTWYGKTKLMGEQCISLIPNASILRLGFIYGDPKKDKYSLISSLIKKEKFFRVGDYQKDYLYIDDCIEAIKRIIDIKYVGVINIGGGRAYKTQDIVKFLNGDLSFLDNQSDYIKSFVILPSKIYHLTKWRPITDFWVKLLELRKEYGNENTHQRKSF